MSLIRLGFMLALTGGDGRRASRQHCTVTTPRPPPLEGTLQLVNTQKQFGAVIDCHDHGEMGTRRVGRSLCQVRKFN